MTWDDVVKTAYEGYQFALKTHQTELADAYTELLRTLIVLRDIENGTYAACESCFAKRPWHDETMCYGCLAERGLV